MGRKKKNRGKLRMKKCVGEAMFFFFAFVEMELLMRSDVSGVWGVMNGSTGIRSATALLSDLT